VAVINVPNGKYKENGHVAEIVKVDLKGSTKSITLREADYPIPGIYERTITGNSLEEIQREAHIEGYYKP